MVYLKSLCFKIPLYVQESFPEDTSSNPAIRNLQMNRNKTL